MAVTFDQARAAFPSMGFALYAMEPGKGVTLEVYDGEEIFRFVGRTEEAAILKAFPNGLPGSKEEPTEVITASIFD